MYLKSKLSITPLLTVLTLASTFVEAQVLNETQGYEVPEPSHFFGTSIGVSDGFLAAGFEDLAGQDDSGIHLFNIDTGLLIRTLIPTSATQILGAGRDVAIDGLTVACTERAARPRRSLRDRRSGARSRTGPRSDRCDR